MRRSILRQFATRKAAYPFHLKLLGVPEQVNIPIQLCQEQGIFSKFGVDVDYTTVPEGTGAMLKKLHDNGTLLIHVCNFSSILFLHDCDCMCRS